MGDSYATEFERLGTPEGQFHAIFAAKSHSVRTRIRRFISQYRDDPQVRTHAEALAADQNRLWTSWTAGLGPELRQFVARAEKEQHGRSIDLEGRPDFEGFLRTYAEVDGNVRRQLERFSQRRPDDEGIRAFIQAVLSDLDQLGDALNEFTGQGRA